LQHLRGDCAWEPAFSSHLNNARKHGVWHSSYQPDPFSSGRWFEGWYMHERDLIHRPLRSPPVAPTRDFTIGEPGFREFSVTFVPGRRVWENETESLDALLAS